MNNTIGSQIALLRKQRNLTQENLAEQLKISAQAISKWENGHSLPETAILVDLASLLNCSIDSILKPQSLFILKAVLTDGFDSIDVTDRANKFINGNSLNLIIDSNTLAIEKSNVSTLWFLTVKYKNENGLQYTYCKNNERLVIDSSSTVFPLTEKISIIDAFYGNTEHNYNVMIKIKHYDFFKFNEYRANYEMFPSNPGTDTDEFLTFVYSNDSGIHITACKEKESIIRTPDQKNFIRKNPLQKIILKDIPMLRFGNNMDCSWAGAITEALKYLGEDTTYEYVMGVSGACYRLAFHYPAWDYSSVDGLVAYDYSTPLYKAFGYSQDYSSRVEKENRKQEREKITNSLKNNIPVVAINLRVAPEWGIITGFTENGNALLCRTYFDEKTFNGDYFHGDTERLKQLMLDMEITDGYLYADNWPFLISYFTKKAEKPSKQINLINSLKIFTDCVNKPKKGNYYMGYQAYETWASSLINDVSEEKMSKEDFQRYQSVNHFCMIALVDARRSARSYLKDSATNFKGDIQEKLLKLANIFNDIYIEVNSVFLQLSDGFSDTGKTWTVEIREKQAAMLLKARAYEKQAEKIAGQIIKQL